MSNRTNNSNNRPARPYNNHRSKPNGFNKRTNNNNNGPKKTFEITIPRLILRNLNFKIKEDDLKAQLEKYGVINDLKLPKKPDGTPFGYGFVSYSSKAEAINAMSTINAMQEKLLGTRVVVDWCLPKNVFLKNKEERAADENIKQEPKSNGKKEVQKPVSENDEEEEDEEEKSDGSENEDEDGEQKDGEGSDNENDDEDEDEDEDDSEADSDDDDNKKKVPKIEKEKLQQNIEQGTRDIQEKRTIFVRNISYDTKEEQLKEEFSKYGEIKYCRLCYDRDFERPKGTAFIQFETAESAQHACSESNILEIDSRKIQIDLAMSRREINDIVVEKKTKIPEDRRNITLAREGFIDPKSDEGQKLPKADLAKRAKIEATNNAKLKLLHYFVSTTRLSVHNLPVKVTDLELKKMFLNAVKDEQDVRIVEYRIMRDLKRVTSDGVGKSRGYGFVQFTKFEHARKALHELNNNPKIFPDKTRLIVQFSIEDMRALKKKEMRVERETHKKGRFNSSHNSSRNGKPDEFTKHGKFSSKKNPELSEDKKREKNLLRLNILEKKLNKRKQKTEQQNGEQASKRPKVTDESVGGVVAEQKKNNRLKDKRQRQKMNRKLKPVKSDHVDTLVDKYLNKKNNVNKRKWYE